MVRTRPVIAQTVTYMAVLAIAYLSMYMLGNVRLKLLLRN